jgi:DNA-binding NtrC family response regulator
LIARVRADASRGGFTVELPLAGVSCSRLHSDGFKFESPLAAATFIISAALDLPYPFLTDDARTFAALCSALRAARTARPILLEGETGTGKESLVRMIHAASGHGALQVVNCAALDHELCCETADGASSAPGDGHIDASNTVFLDHVHELSAPAQLRLCALIRRENRLADTPGCLHNRVHYVAATNWPLAERTARGAFDRELHATLSAHTVALPPLRERKADCVLLARFLMHELRPELTFGRAAQKVLSEYPLPGNARELRNLVARLSIALPLRARVIRARDVRAQLMAAGRPPSLDPARGWQICCAAAHREIAMREIRACAGDHAAAASRLGIALSTLRRRLALPSGHGGARSARRRVASSAPPARRPSLRPRPAR